MNLYCVVVTYNAEKWIDQCIASLLNSSINAKIIVIDNRSTDKTLECLAKFEEIVCIPLKSNIGFGRANNIGLCYALDQHCDFVFLLNQDAYVQQNTIQQLVITAQQHREYGILSPVHLTGDGTGIDSKFLQYVSTNGADTLVADLYLHETTQPVYELSFVNAAAWLVSSGLLSKVGGFDPLFFMYGEDEDLCKRAKIHGFKVGIVPSSAVYHYRSTSPVSGYAKWLLKPIRRNSVEMIRHLKDYNGVIGERFIGVTVDFAADLLRSLARLRWLSALLLIASYLYILVSFPIIWRHKRQSLKIGTHWLTSR